MDDTCFWMTLFSLQLDRPFNASEAVKAVGFLRAGGTNPEAGAEVETAGWGSQNNLESRPDKLREVVVNVVRPTRCSRSDYFGSKFTSNMMCANKVCKEPCDQPDNVQDSCDVSSPPCPKWMSSSWCCRKEPQLGQMTSNLPVNSICHIFSGVTF